MSGRIDVKSFRYGCQVMQLSMSLALSEARTEHSVGVRV